MLGFPSNLTGIARLEYCYKLIDLMRVIIHMQSK